MSSYYPRRGDVMWITLNPQAGHEQSGHRPALVLSPEAYNRKTGLAILCPITSRAKGYPFEVALPSGFKVSGVALADQVRSMDWRARGAKLAAVAPEGVVREVSAKLRVLTG